jgi:hypothetical protein
LVIDRYNKISATHRNKTTGWFLNKTTGTKPPNGLSGGFISWWFYYNFRPSIAVNLVVLSYQFSPTMCHRGDICSMATPQGGRGGECSGLVVHPASAQQTNYQLGQRLSSRAICHLQVSPCVAYPTHPRRQGARCGGAQCLTRHHCRWLVCVLPPYTIPPARAGAARSI